MVGAPRSGRAKVVFYLRPRVARLYFSNKRIDDIFVASQKPGLLGGTYVGQARGALFQPPKKTFFRWTNRLNVFVREPWAA